MLYASENQISCEDKIEAAEIAEMARTLPKREKERFFYMMKGVALMGKAEYPFQEADPPPAQSLNTHTPPQAPHSP